jgi:plastocyanin
VRAFVAALAAVAVCSCAIAASAGTPAPARVQVAAKEFYFVLSRRSIIAGPAIVELVNFGEDPHDLRLQRVGGAHIAGTPQVQPGDHFDLSLTLRAGKYRLWCSIANHRQLGMQAVLTVVAKTKS